MVVAVTARLVNICFTNTVLVGCNQTIMFSSIYRLTHLLVPKEARNNSKTRNIIPNRAEGTTREDGRQRMTQKGDMDGREL